MKKQAAVAGLMLTFVLGSPVFSYAGKVELTTYYPAPYGEYRELKATGQTADNADIALEAKGNTGAGLVVTNANRVGIGTANPSALLEVQNGTVSASGLTAPGQIRITSDYAQLDFIDSGNNDWAIHVNDGKMYFIRQPWNVSDLVLNGSGNVGIGTTTPTEKLHVNGKIKATSVETTDFTVGGGVIRSGQRTNFTLNLQPDRNMCLYDNGGGLWCTSTQVSDVSLKKDIVLLDHSLETVTNLRGIRFHWVNEEWGTQSEIGVIAQDLEEAFPELVYTDKKYGYKLVRYEKLAPILIEAIKEQQKEILELRQSLVELRAEVNAKKAE